MKTTSMTPEEFWITAAGWGSYIRPGDPGACLYGFNERGRVQNEAHRAACIAYLNTECRKAAQCNEDPAADNAEIDALIAYLESAETMAYWRDTQEAADFLKSADSRNTSSEIMEAIAFFARNKQEAEELWNGDGFGRICNPIDLWEHITHNGRLDPEDFFWGASGSNWWNDINPGT